MAQETGLSIFGDMRAVELTPVAGWTHAYNINTEIVDITNVGSGTVTQSSGMGLLSTTAAINSSALMETRRVLRYIPGMGALVRFTAAFTTPVSGSRQVIGLGTPENGFYIGYIDTDFVVVRLSNSVETTIVSSAFNYPLNPDLDFTKGNVFQINYQWLGFGLIRFSYEHPDTSLFTPMHDIKYQNTATVPSTINPTMPIFAKVENTTNDTNIELRTPSAMAFREGGYLPLIDPLSIARSFTGEATVTTEVPIIAVRSKATYQSVTNQIHFILELLSFATDGNKTVQFKLYRGGTLTGASWSDYSTNTSSLESDTSASALSNGIFIMDYQLAKIDSLAPDITNLNLSFQSGEILTITATSALTNDVNATVLVHEPF